MAAQREWFDKDYYAVLGVPSSATEKELSRAYKKLAKQHHPDANPGNAAAEERFKEVNAAYDVLGDADEAHGVRRGPPHGRVRRRARTVRRIRARRLRVRRRPDVPVRHRFGRRPGRHLRQPVRRMAAAAAGGRAPRPDRSAGQDLETELHLSFDDAVRGVTRTVRFRADATCSTCNGSGAAPGTMPETCPECHGSGSIADRPGPVLVLAGVPHVRRARPGHPHAVPDVSAAAASRCAPAR